MGARKLNALPCNVDEGPKQECRDAIVSAAQRCLSTTPKTFLTLPSEQPWCVRTFKKTFPGARYIGVESDPKVFDRIDTDLEDIDLYGTTLVEYSRSIKFRHRHVDVAFFDYCGPWSEDRLNETAEVLANPYLFEPTKRSILAFTFQRNIRVKHKESLDFIGNNVYVAENEDVENSVDTVGRCLEYVAGKRRRIGWGCLESRQYHSTNKSCEMYFLLYQVTFGGAH
jgi:hypothetical protein